MGAPASPEIEAFGIAQTRLSHVDARVVTGICPVTDERFLELVPQVLVVDLVVELHFRGFDDRAQQARTAVG